MSKWFHVMFCTVAFSSALSGEILVEFDGQVWKLPKGFAEMTREAKQEGVCYMADANVPAGLALKGLGIEQLLGYPVRFALRGQEGQGAKLDPILPGKQEAENMIAVLCEDGRVMAQRYPEEHKDLPDNSRRGIMDDDFSGLESFLKLIRSEVKIADAAGEIPRFCLVVKPKTSFGQMVRLIQLVRSAGCMSGVVRVYEGFSGLQFDQLSNPNVSLPVVEVPKAEPSGIIVLNISEDGTVYVGQNIILADDRDVIDYVSSERVRLEAAGLSARFQLHADANSIYKWSRNAIRAAAKGGVKEACFAVYEVDPASRESPAKWRMKEIPVTFSNPDETLAKAGDEASAPVEIAIARNGSISLPKETAELDKDPEKRDLPLLKAKLKAIAAAKGIFENELKVSMLIDAGADQQRVIDVLSLLAQIGMTRVSIADIGVDGGK